MGLAFGPLGSSASGTAGIDQMLVWVSGRHETVGGACEAMTSDRSLEQGRRGEAPTARKARQQAGGKQAAGNVVPLMNGGWEVCINIEGY